MVIFHSYVAVYQRVTCLPTVKLFLPLEAPSDFSVSHQWMSWCDLHHLVPYLRPAKGVGWHIPQEHLSDTTKKTILWWNYRNRVLRVGECMLMLRIARGTCSSYPWEVPLDQKVPATCGTCTTCPLPTWCISSCPFQQVTYWWYVKSYIIIAIYSLVLLIVSVLLHTHINDWFI
jgi:hypothetical protein